jgi:hypothetical protein
MTSDFQMPIESNADDRAGLAVRKAARAPWVEIVVLGVVLMALIVVVFWLVRSPAMR